MTEEVDWRREIGLGTRLNMRIDEARCGRAAG